MRKLLFMLLIIIGGYAANAQDLIMLKSGNEIENVKVLDTLESVIYRNGTQASTIAKSDVLWIKYSNGTKVKLNANAKTAQTVVAPPKAELPAKKSDPVPPVMQTKVEQPIKEPAPTIEKALPTKSREEPTEDKDLNNKFLNDLAAKLKSEGGAEKFKPRGFGLGANISLLGGENFGVSVIMPLSVSTHFRFEPEIGFGVSTFGKYMSNSSLNTSLYLNPENVLVDDGLIGYYGYAMMRDIADVQISTYKLGIGLYGMTQRGKVNLYIGPAIQYNKAILNIEEDFNGNPLFFPGSKLSNFQIIPTVGAEYGLSNHFTIGGDIGIPIMFESFKTAFREDNNGNIIIERITKIHLLTRARFMLRFYF